MFSQVDIKTISTVFGKTVDEVSGAASSEDEKSLGLRLDGSVLTEAKQKELKETAIQQGKEIGLKETAKALGLTLGEGEKDPEKIAEKFKATISTELEEKYKNPDPSKELVEAMKKIGELENANEKLTETLTGKESELSEWEKKHNTLITENTVKENNNKILKSFSPKMTMNKDHALLIINNKLVIEKDEQGRDIGKIDGKTVLNTAGQPETIENIVTGFVEENGWIGSGTGMNGGDRSTVGKTSKGGKTNDEAFKLIKEAGIEPGSQEGLKMFKEYTSPVEA